ncbi:hypothetical protein NMY22_g13724 [Coprinellus aureogranulatus]|nr:hypothetical protein NMY22_g13724 [Coprinellus aureogranulatus]
MGSSAPPDPLVDDVLVDIFLYLLDPWPSRLQYQNIHAVSQVCRQWRTVALSCPELWRRFPFLTGEDGDHCPMFTDMVLNRCGSLSIDIGWQGRPHCDETLDTILAELKHIHRCRSYVLDDKIYLTSHTAFKREVAQRAAPALEHINLRVNLGSCLLVPFFGNDLPKLKTLRFENVVVPLQNVRAPTLQHVDYTSKYLGDPVHPSTWPCAFKLVASFRNLKTLRLWLFHKQEVLGNDIIEMPHLQSLDLSMRVPYIEQLLRRVRMPLCRRVWVDVCSQLYHHNGDGTMENWAKKVTKAIIEHAVVPLGLDEGRGYELSFSRLESVAVEAAIHPFNGGIGARPTDAFMVRTSADELRETRSTSIVRGVVEGFLPLLGSLKIVKVVKPSKSHYIDYPTVFREFTGDRSILFMYPDGKPHMHAS